MTEPNRDHQLQQYFDGELSPEVAEALRLEIESDEVLQAKLEGLSHLRVLIRGALAPEHLDVPSDDAMFAAIEARLGEPEVGVEAESTSDDPKEEDLRPVLRVVAGGKDASDVEGAQKAPTGAPAWFGVAGLMLAAAAALWFFVLRPGDPGTVPQTPDTPEVTDPIVAVSSSRGQTAPAPGSEIEQIDLGHSTGAIFQVEDQGARYAVVWIGDEKPSDLMPGAIDQDEERVQ